jgi:aminodeoxyfutalosine synthase
MITANKEDELLQIINSFEEGKHFTTIAKKIIYGKRITDEEGMLLFEKASLGLAATFANYVREKKHGDITYFNRNFHIEPTNVCVFSCKFCSQG